jgi:organic hydroperoxide reductase OsmC/OhrA
MTVMKEIQLPVSIRWRGGSVVRADGRDKKPLELAASPRFQALPPGYWSPDDLLVVSTASSFVLTLAAIAEWRETPLLDATVSATGHMSHRDDGRFGLTVIEINAELETTPGSEADVKAVAKAAEARCLVAQALDVPVHVAVTVRTASPSATSNGARQSLRPSRRSVLTTRS